MCPRYRAKWLALVVVLMGAAFLTADDSKPPPARGRQLPPNWAKIGLSTDQKEKIYSIQAEYRTKIDELNRQISELRKKQNRELETVLTEAQKARLREILLEKAPGAGTPLPEKKVDSGKEKKSDNKP